MRESTIQAAIRKAIALDGRALVTRNSVGMAIYPDGSKVRYGLGVGSADLVGMLIPSGRVFCLECKRDGRDNTSRRRKALQAAWARAVRARGGFVATVRSVPEAMAALERACRGESQ